MNRQICCWKTDHRLLYKCQHVKEVEHKNKKGQWTYYYWEEVECGNLMHADCIERLGKCHKDAGVKKYERVTGNS